MHHVWSSGVSLDSSEPTSTAPEQMLDFGARKEEEEDLRSMREH